MNSIQANGKFWDKSSISQRVNVVHFLASALLHPSQINDFLSMCQTSLMVFISFVKVPPRTGTLSLIQNDRSGVVFL